VFGQQLVADFEPVFIGSMATILARGFFQAALTAKTP